MPYLSRAAALFVTLAPVLSLAACTWEPVTRPVQPELVLAGVMRVDRTVDENVLIEEYLGERSRWHLLSTETLTSCVLEEGRPLPAPMRAPNLRGKDVPRVLLPVRRNIGDVDELWVMDEKCAVRGPFGEIGDDPAIIKLSSDARDVAFVFDTQGNLRLFDPWTNRTQLLGSDVSRWATVLRAEGSSAAREPDALWLVEAGQLRRRAYDGTLLVQIGQRVGGFAQRLTPDGTRLRIAYEDGGDVYEALSPDYTPVRIAMDACRPSYEGEALDIHTPCKAEQLVRIEAGQVRYFPPGVYRVHQSGDMTLQFVRNEARQTELWVELKSGPRIKLTPTPVSPITLLDAENISGRTTDGRFGFWTLRDGFKPLMSGIRDIVPYRMQRSSQYMWLVYHEDATIVDEEQRKLLGRLSTFEEGSAKRTIATGEPLELRTLAENVPERGFRPYPAPFYDEPILLLYERMAQNDGGLFTGDTLSARLLSGRLGARIDDNVTSSTLVLAPQPGVLYTIGEGARRGLWFAAL